MSPFRIVLGLDSSLPPRIALSASPWAIFEHVAVAEVQASAVAARWFDAPVELHAAPPGERIGPHAARVLLARQDQPSPILS